MIGKKSCYRWTALVGSVVKEALHLLPLKFHVLSSIFNKINNIVLKNSMYHIDQYWATFLPPQAEKELCVFFPRAAPMTLV